MRLFFILLQNIEQFIVVAFLLLAACFRGAATVCFQKVEDMAAACMYLDP